MRVRVCMKEFCDVVVCEQACQRSRFDAYVSNRPVRLKKVIYVEESLPCAVSQIEIYRLHYVLPLSTQCGQQ